MNDVLWKDDNGQWWLFRDLDSTLMHIHGPGTERVYCGYRDDNYMEVDPEYAWCEPNSGHLVRGRKVKNLPL